ncbi:MAG TPA: hypothetical protein VGI74_01210 [Streptosporangiaceae bacterium]|jgi:hypothetical protein
MFQKSRVLAVAAMAVGAIGLWASAASAGTGPSGDNGGLVNVSHNQVPVMACGNEVPVNVLGVQAVVDRVAEAVGLQNTQPVTAIQDSSCKQGAVQANATPSKKPGNGPSGDNGGLVNVSHNQVPLQVCNNHVPVNVAGVQVPVDQVAGALGILSPGSVAGGQDSSCKQASGQEN